jgi:hypothetical protein
MARMTVIMNKKGKLVGALRTGTVKVGKDTINVVARPHPDHVHHEIDIEDAELRKPLSALRESVLRKIKM